MTRLGAFARGVPTADRTPAPRLLRRRRTLRILRQERYPEPASKRARGRRRRRWPTVLRRRVETECASSPRSITRLSVGCPRAIPAAPAQPPRLQAEQLPVQRPWYPYAPRSTPWRPRRWDEGAR